MWVSKPPNNNSHRALNTAILIKNKVGGEKFVQINNAQKYKQDQMAF